MSTNLFNTRTHLFDFCMDSNYKFKFNQQIPRLKDEFHQNVSESQLIQMGFNRNLEDGFDQQMANQTMITDCEQFRAKKWTGFLQCLQQKGSVGKEEPKFVFSSGIMNGLFGSIGTENVFYAQMFRGVIYLYRSQSLESKDKVSSEVSKGIYSLKRFRFLITDRNVWDFNKWEKHIRVDSIDFRGNKFVVYYIINAIDKNECPIDISCRRMQFMNNKVNHNNSSSPQPDKALNDWIQCMTKNINTIVYGHRIKKDKESKATTLRYIRVMTDQQMRDKYGIDWPQSDDQFSYFNDSLNHIKSCVKTESMVYEFEVKDKVISLLSEQIITKSIGFLPKFYTE